MIDSTKRISTMDFMEMYSMTTRINDAVERFSKGGWVEGEEYPSRWLELKKYLMDSDKRYHSAKISGVKIRAGTVSGRILVTFEAPYAQVTVIGGEDEPDRGCGLQSIDASAHEAQAIIDEVIVKWDLASFAPDGKARIF